MPSACWPCGSSVSSGSSGGRCLAARSGVGDARVGGVGALPGSTPGAQCRARRGPSSAAASLPEWRPRDSVGGGAITGGTAGSLGGATGGSVASGASGSLGSGAGGSVGSGAGGSVGSTTGDTQLLPGVPAGMNSPSAGAGRQPAASLAEVCLPGRSGSCHGERAAGGGTSDAGAAGGIGATGGGGVGDAGGGGVGSHDTRTSGSGGAAAGSGARVGGGGGGGGVKAGLGPAVGAGGGGQVAAGGPIGVPDSDPSR